MSPALNEALVERVNALGSVEWTGECHRFTSARRDPLSGEGARRFGGRWNPPSIFPTLYLAQPTSTCMGEFDRQAAAQSIDPTAMLAVPFTLHTINVTGLPVLDLRQPAAQQYVGLDPEDIAGDDMTACQAVGHAAWFLEMAGVVAPSATGHGLVVAAFEHRAHPGQITAGASERLTPDRYLELRQ